MAEGNPPEARPEFPFNLLSFTAGFFLNLQQFNKKSNYGQRIFWEWILPVRYVILVCLIFTIGCNLPATRQNLDGRRSFELGNYQGALHSFQLALQTNPSNADAHYNVGRTLHHIGKAARNDQQLAQAEQAYRTALGLNPSHQPAYRGLSVLLAENKRTPEAFALLRHWGVMQPQSAEPKIELARLYVDQGNRQTATQVLSDALLLDNDNDRALRALGTLREESGDLRQAAHDYQRSLQINPMQPDLANRLAQIQFRGGIAPTSGPTLPRVAEVPAFPRF